MSDHTYVARFGFTRRDFILVPACAVFVAAGVYFFPDDPVPAGLSCLLGGLYLVVLVLAAVVRRVAFAVTAEGITLGMIPPWPTSYTAFVPWSDVEAVVLWRQRLFRIGLWPQYPGRQTVGYVGVVRRAGAPPLPGSARSSMLRKVNSAVVPGDLSEDLVADSRQVGFWRLDPERLAAAVDHFAPDVKIIEHS